MSPTRSSLLYRPDHTKLQCYDWLPENGKPKAILYVVHGMVEHAKRYDELALFLNHHQIAVMSHDQREHGLTQELNANSSNGQLQRWDEFIADLDERLRLVSLGFDETPIFLLGHSMGTYITLTYACTTPTKIAGIILSGASSNSRVEAFSGWLLTKCIIQLGLSENRASWIQKLIFGGYNKKIKSRKTDFDWLSVDTKNVAEYISDPMCGFIATYRFYHQLFTGLLGLGKSAFRKIPSRMPFLIMSGKLDPHGGFGVRVLRLARLLRRAGLRDISVILYNKSRHEILNDQEKTKVCHDILMWIDTHVT